MLPTSNAQHDQRYKSDADEQHYERNGVVFEPMPITGKHDVSSLFQMDEPPSLSWLIASIRRRMRTRLPTCRSVGLGTFFSGNGKRTAMWLTAR